jgi:hypothetical protein
MNSTKAISKGWRVVFSDKWKRGLRAVPKGMPHAGARELPIPMAEIYSAGAASEDGASHHALEEIVREVRSRADTASQAW